jgi:hypothetical protein
MKKTQFVFIAGLALAFMLVFAACGGSSPGDGPGSGSKVQLAEYSWGTANSNAIAGLNAGDKYVVKTNSTWYSLKSGGTLGAPYSNLADAVSNTVVTSSMSITGLDNDETYDVYLVYEGINNYGLGSSSKHTIWDISHIDAGGGPTNKTGILTFANAMDIFYIYTNDAITVTQPSETVAGQKIEGTAKDYTFVTDNNGGAKVAASSGDKFFTLTTITAATSLTNINVTVH